MYQKRSRLQNLIILLLDCICITVSLILANYIRNGRLFSSDDIRMDFGMLLGASLTVFLAMNLFRNLNRNMFLRGPLHELIHILRNNIILFAGTAVILYFLNLLEAYSRLVFFYFLILDCLAMFCVHQLWKLALPALYRYFGETRKMLLVADMQNAQALADDMLRMKDYSYEMTGIVIVDGKGQENEFEGLPVACSADLLVDYCKSSSLDEVIVAVLQHSCPGIKRRKAERAFPIRAVLHGHLCEPGSAGGSGHAQTSFRSGGRCGGLRDPGSPDGGAGPSDQAGIPGAGLLCPEAGRAQRPYF